MRSPREHRALALQIFIEMKLSLSKRLRELRLSQQLSQHGLAKKINSSQSRVAKMEAGDPSVSLDLIVRTLLVMGATREDVAIALAQRNEVIASSQS